MGPAARAGSGRPGRDSLLVVAAARLPVLLGSDDAPPRGALALGRPADLHLEVVPASLDATAVLRAASMVPDGGWVASLEVRGDGWSARARHGAPAPVLDDGFGLSAPVLVQERGADAPDRPLHEVLLPSSDPGGRERVGVYVEIYGVADDELLDMRVSLEPVDIDASLLRRIGRMLRLLPGASDEAVRVEWVEPAEVILPGVSAHHLGIDAGSPPSGTYALVVEVERGNGRVARSSTRMRIER